MGCIGFKQTLECGQLPLRLLSVDTEPQIKRPSEFYLVQKNRNGFLRYIFSQNILVDVVIVFNFFICGFLYKRIRVSEVKLYLRDQPKLFRLPRF